MMRLPEIPGEEWRRRSVASFSRLAWRRMGAYLDGEEEDNFTNREEIIGR